MMKIAERKGGLRAAFLISKVSKHKFIFQYFGKALIIKMLKFNSLF